MPLYEYRCDNCGRTFEVIQKFSDPLAEHCLSCGKGPVHKLMSSPAIQFKGSGWYVTDYASKDKVTATKADNAASEKADKAEKSEKKDEKSSKTTESSSSSSTSSDKGSKKD